MKKGYGQFCPIAKASEVLGERWTHLVIRELGAGSETFNDLRRGLPLMSPSLLSKRLKSLQAAGVVARDEGQAGVRYTLTEAGLELKPILRALGTWGQRWARGLGSKDPDPSLLMWDIHRTMDASYFGIGRTVLLFEFTDYTSQFRRWWLVVDGEAGEADVDVCLKDPGHEVDLHLITDLESLTGLWMGEIRYNQAVRSKRLIMHGPGKLKKDIRRWLGTNFFADVESAAENPGLV